MIKHQASQYGTMWYIENVSDVKKIAYTDGEKGYDLDAIVLWYRRPTGRDYVTRRQFYCTGKPYAWCEQTFRSGHASGTDYVSHYYAAPVDGTYTITVTDQETGVSSSYTVSASAGETVYVYDEDIPEFSVVVIRFEPNTASWDFLNEDMDSGSEVTRWIRCTGQWDTVDRVVDFSLVYDSSLSYYKYVPEENMLILNR